MGQEASGGGQEWECENRVWMVGARGWCVDGGERRVSVCGAAAVRR